MRGCSIGPVYPDEDRGVRVDHAERTRVLPGRRSRDDRREEVLASPPPRTHPSPGSDSRCTRQMSGCTIQSVEQDPRPVARRALHVGRDPDRQCSRSVAGEGPLPVQAPVARPVHGVVRREPSVLRVGEADPVDRARRRLTIATTHRRRTSSAKRGVDRPPTRDRRRRSAPCRPVCRSDERTLQCRPPSVLANIERIPATQTWAASDGIDVREVVRSRGTARVQCCAVDRSDDCPADHRVSPVGGDHLDPGARQCQRRSRRSGSESALAPGRLRRDGRRGRRGVVSVCRGRPRTAEVVADAVARRCSSSSTRRHTDDNALDENDDVT